MSSSLTVFEEEGSEASVRGLAEDQRRFSLIFSYFSAFSGYICMYRWSEAIRVAELMLLGFISLLLTVFQERINKICISEELATKFMPCKKPSDDKDEGTTAHFQTFFSAGVLPATVGRRLLSEDSSAPTYCSIKVKFQNAFLLFFLFSCYFFWWSSTIELRVWFHFFLSSEC